MSPPTFYLFTLLGCCSPVGLERFIRRVIGIGRQIRVDLAVTDKATLVLERAPEGKILVTSGSWDGEKVFLRDQALAVGNVEGRTSHARIGDRPMEPADRAAHDCYG
ncbi:MAG: hypothetical protein WAK67_09250 [Xanthobacteraceae bacterium]